MLKSFKIWFSKKITIIFAPSHGSRSFHIQLSYPFTTFLLLLIVSIFTVGGYFSKVYISYIHAIEANKKLVEEKNLYSTKVEETLNMLQKVKNIEVRLKGMLGMKSTRNIIENYHIGGAHSKDKVNLPIEINSIYEQNRFNSNINEVKRETWEQQQNIKYIENFINKKRNMLLSTPSIWPVFGYMTSGYGWRTHPILKRREYHRAIDIYSVLERRSPIRATAQGRIIVAGWAGSYGKTIIIDHGNGFSTRYCHCSKILVKQGERVEHGQIIAYIGNTGLSTGPHLHYEVWYRGKPVNPLRFVKER